MYVSFPGKKRYEGVRLNVISITRGWVGVKFPGKKLYVTFEWPGRCDWYCDRIDLFTVPSVNIMVSC